MVGAFHRVGVATGLLMAMARSAPDAPRRIKTVEMSFISHDHGKLPVWRPVAK